MGRAVILTTFILVNVIIAGAAEAARIRCPETRIETGILDRIEGPWWQTPNIVRLSGTDVRRIGGDETLVCIYGSRGTQFSIMRHFPVGTTSCRAIDGGFSCRRESASGSSLYTHGILRIDETWFADLDNGRVGGRSDGDIWFEAETETRRYITPVNGARIALMATRPRGRRDCDRARLTSRRVSVRDVRDGSYFCVLTNERRISLFEVIDNVGRSPTDLAINYRTWP